MAGSFVLKNKVNLRELTKDTIVPPSDFALQVGDDFIQFEYKEAEKTFAKYPVKPGIYSILKTMAGYDLKPTSYARDGILDEFVSTKHIEEVVDCFFKNIPLYAEFGIEVPKRGVLLYGPAGGGKTTALNKCIEKYAADGRTAVVSWQTSKYEASEVQDFIRCFDYQGVDKIILVCEDLGGIENEQTRMRSDSSLLSLLDNQEKTFTIPVMIIATTNYPENFAANIMNRPGRFDDKIEVPPPSGDARKALLNFFSKGAAPQEALTLIASDKCKEFVPAQIREVYIRSRLRSKSITDTIKEMLEEVELYNKAFSKRKGVGF